jgi:hypothetical protein
LRELNDNGRIVVADLNIGRNKDEERTGGKWNSERDIIYLDIQTVGDLDITLPGTLIHEGTHRNDAKRKWLILSTLSCEKRAFLNQYIYEKETNPELAFMPSDDDLRDMYPYLQDDLN